MNATLNIKGRCIYEQLGPSMTQFSDNFVTFCLINQL